jgi:hypothetical protein
MFQAPDLTGRMMCSLPTAGWLLSATVPAAIVIFGQCNSMSPDPRARLIEVRAVVLAGW